MVNVETADLAGVSYELLLEEVGRRIRDTDTFLPGRAESESPAAVTRPPEARAPVKRVREPADYPAPTCPPWCDTDDHQPDGWDVEVNYSHETHLLREQHAEITVGVVETIPTPAPEEIDRPSVWVEINREDVSPADLRRWAAELLKAAEFVERLPVGP